MKVQSNVGYLVNCLEANTGRKWPLSVMAADMGITHTTVRSYVSARAERFDAVVLAKWLEFFSRHGMPVSIGDLFQVAD